MGGGVPSPTLAPSSETRREAEAKGLQGCVIPFFFFLFSTSMSSEKNIPLDLGWGLLGLVPLSWIWALTLGPKAGGTALRGGEARLGALRCRFLA